MHASGSFDELLKLVEMDNRLPSDPEAGGCGMHNHICHNLSTSPHVFTIGNSEEIFLCFFSVMKAINAHGALTT